MHAKGSGHVPQAGDDDVIRRLRDGGERHRAARRRLKCRARLLFKTTKRRKFQRRLRVILGVHRHRRHRHRLGIRDYNRRHRKRHRRRRLVARDVKLKPDKADSTRRRRRIKFKSAYFLIRRRARPNDGKRDVPRGGREFVFKPRLVRRQSVHPRSKRKIQRPVAADAGIVRHRRRFRVILFVHAHHGARRRTAHGDLHEFILGGVVPHGVDAVPRRRADVARRATRVLNSRKRKRLRGVRLPVDGSR